MSFEDKLDRINALAHKAKSEGLTETEKTEQKKLRKEYLSGIRESFTEQFKTMTVVDPKGEDVTPDKVKALHKKNDKDEE